MQIDLQHNMTNNILTSIFWLKKAKFVAYVYEIEFVGLSRLLFGVRFFVKVSHTNWKKGWSEFNKGETKNRAQWLCDIYKCRVSCCFQNGATQQGRKK